MKACTACGQRLDTQVFIIEKYTATSCAHIYDYGAVLTSQFPQAATNVSGQTVA